VNGDAWLRDRGWPAALGVAGTRLGRSDQVVQRAICLSIIGSRRRRCLNRGCRFSRTLIGRAGMAKGAFTPISHTQISPQQVLNKSLCFESHHRTGTRRGNRWARWASGMRTTPASARRRVGRCFSN